MSGPGLLTSGQFETVLVDRVSTLLRPDVFAGIMARRPLNRAMKSFTSTEVSARAPGAEVPVQLDGELWGELPMSFRIEPGALNVVPVAVSISAARSSRIRMRVRDCQHAAGFAFARSKHDSAVLFGVVVRSSAASRPHSPIRNARQGWSTTSTAALALAAAQGC